MGTSKLGWGSLAKIMKGGTVEDGNGGTKVGEKMGVGSKGDLSGGGPNNGGFVGNVMEGSLGGMGEIGGFVSWICLCLMEPTLMAGS